MCVDVCLLVFVRCGADKDTGVSRGSAFVKFASADEAQHCVASLAEQAFADVVIKGRSFR